MKRELLHKLIEWKASHYRKPLILTGIRQCGKTFILRHFGDNYFPKVHYFNFEKEQNLNVIFEHNLKPGRIINELSYKIGQEINIEQDLIIFDEIQACPLALTSLKYFYEDMPNLHLCGAGSLLGVALNHVSFPVGKVTHLQLYPMSFNEFLLAIGQEQLYKLLKQTNFDTEIPELAHQKLWEVMQWYWITGGLPEVVKTFSENQENLFQAFTKSRKKQEDLIFTYYGDIAKHSGKVNAMHIDRVWKDVSKQLSKSQDTSVNKFKFKGIIPGIDRYSRLAGAIDWLVASGLIIKVPIINNAELPLSAYTQESKFKCFMADVGILGAISDLPFQAILNYNFGTYKGFFAENFVAQELLAAKGNNFYSWQDNRHEVEFVIQDNELILPIEVKSGKITKAISLQKFKDKYKPKYISIMSGHNLNIDKKNHICRYPLYLAGKFPLK